MTLEALHRVLEASGARRLVRGQPLWVLRRTLWPPFRRGEALLERQAAVLAAVRALPWEAFLRTGADPRAWAGGEGGPWPRAARDTWRVPSRRAAVDGLLRAGAWTLYLAPHALDPALLPDTFRAPLGEVVAFVESHSVPVLVDAWRDNAEWRIVVAPAAVPGLAAA